MDLHPRLCRRVSCDSKSRQVTLVVDGSSDHMMFNGGCDVKGFNLEHEL